MEITLILFIQARILNVLNRKARKVCWIGAIIVALILAFPMYLTLLAPGFLKKYIFGTTYYIGIHQY